jgi:hypothetical protein
MALALALMARVGEGFKAFARFDRIDICDPPL